MPRIDLFVTPGCPSCPRARVVVTAFVAANPEVVLQEWDLTRDPGPAARRGIFATPAVLLDNERILLGVPSLSELSAHFQVPIPGIGFPSASSDPIAAILRAPRPRVRRSSAWLRGPAIAVGFLVALSGLITRGDGRNGRQVPTEHVGEKARVPKTVIRCDCGHVAEGRHDDELVARAQEHARNAHQREITREQALARAEVV